MSPTENPKPAKMNRVGFIGLGNMGLPMAQNFILKSTAQEVFLFDAVSDRTASLLKSNYPKTSADKPRVRVVGTVAELTRHCDAIVTMLPTTNAVVDVCQKHIFPNGHSRSTSLLIIDCSTISPRVSQQLAHQAQTEYHIGFVDAPVSGGVAGAKAGTLTFMVGSNEKSTFVAAQSLLSRMGQKIIHTGGAGTGSTVKLCNNLALAIETIAISEAMNLGIRSGVEPKVLADAMSSSTAACWSSTVNNPCPGVIAAAPSSNGYAGGFLSSLMVKDLKLALLSANEVDAKVPVGKVSLDLYQQMLNQGDDNCDNKDFSIIYEFISKGLK